MGDPSARDPASSKLPRGRVTFVMTDIEISTALLRATSILREALGLQR